MSDRGETSSSEGDKSHTYQRHKERIYANAGMGAIQKSQQVDYEVKSVHNQSMQVTLTPVIDDNKTPQAEMVIDTTRILEKHIMDS